MHTAIVQGRAWGSKRAVTCSVQYLKLCQHVCAAAVPALCNYSQAVHYQGCWIALQCWSGYTCAQSRHSLDNTPDSIMSQS